MQDRKPDIGVLPEGVETQDWQIFDHPTHAKTEELFNYWNTKRSNRQMPLRESFDPIEIPRLLPMILFVQVEGRDPPRFKVRLIGTEGLSLPGENRTGMYIEEFGQGLPTHLRTQLINKWHTNCIATYKCKTPHFTTGVRHDPQKLHRLYHTANFPLTTDGRNVSHLLGMIVTEPVHTAKQFKP